MYYAEDGELLMGRQDGFPATPGVAPSVSGLARSRLQARDTMKRPGNRPEDVSARLKRLEAQVTLLERRVVSWDDLRTQLSHVFATVVAMGFALLAIVYYFMATNAQDQPPKQRPLWRGLFPRHYS